jgi:thioredoxin reductase
MGCIELAMMWQNANFSYQIDWSTGLLVPAVACLILVPLQVLRRKATKMKSQMPCSKGMTGCLSLDDRLKRTPTRFHSAMPGVEFADDPWTLFPGKILANLFMFCINTTFTTAVFTLFVLLPLYGFYWALLQLGSDALYYGWCLLVLVSAVYVTREVMRPEMDPQDVAPPKRIKRVAVIGAGPAGLASAKELLAEGHEVVVLEKANALGGVWQRGVSDLRDRTANVLETTTSTSSAFNTTYSDFPIQAEFPNSPEIYCMPQEYYMNYLKDYCLAFDLERHIHFRENVVKVDRDNDTGMWHVMTERESGKSMNTRKSPSKASKLMEYEFDFVVVCSGQTNIPFIPMLNGQKNFKGTIRHSSELKSAQEIIDLYENKRVLCVGAGETASDVAQLVARRAAKCDVSVRNPVTVLPRNIAGVHGDYFETRNLHSCPRWVRWMTLRLVILFMFPFNFAYARRFQGKIFWPPSFLLIWKLLFTRKYFETFRFNTTKTENMLYIIGGNNKLVPHVCHINELGTIVFEDGTQGEYDEILLLTGYRNAQFNFLPSTFGDSNLNTFHDKYLGVFHPLLPNLAFVGFVRGNVGSLVLGFEMQARWVALIVSEKRKLPGVQCMKNEIARSMIGGVGWTNPTFYTTHTGWYANYLARYHVRCEPNGIQLFLKSPSLWYKVYFGAITSYMYRFRGPHMNFEAAKAGYDLSTAVMWQMPSMQITSVMWLIIGFICDTFWRHVPIIGKNLNTMNNQYR